MKKLSAVISSLLLVITFSQKAFSQNTLPGSKPVVTTTQTQPVNADNTEMIIDVKSIIKSNKENSSNNRFLEVKKLVTGYKILLDKSDTSFSKLIVKDENNITVSSNDFEIFQNGKEVARLKYFIDKNKNLYRIEINFDVKQAGVATQYVVSISKIRSRFPSLGIEKEFAQAVAR